MRIDLCLSRLCLFKTRSQAAKACEEGRVLIQGRKARPSREVRAGDRVEFLDRSGLWRTEVEVLVPPETPVSKAAARELYRLLVQVKVEDPFGEEGGA